eukprot:gnl/TRDRNA2_/TRDRNA2_127417_c1_seq1.p1 gnl/TRDRNA2_/TRDRNA2_127417_c1~~gnl/TRDRNA2_/TRDRNA2_127417_c1_seq1.p1  ORF type:complete len:210 (+),score=32.54 gnl/TRDRNA2_/TRDRNA2_127417_c1_seq1:33-632(+)
MSEGVARHLMDARHIAEVEQVSSRGGLLPPPEDPYSKESGQISQTWAAADGSERRVTFDHLSGQISPSPSDAAGAGASSEASSWHVVNPASTSSAEAADSGWHAATGHESGDQGTGGSWQFASMPGALWTRNQGPQCAGSSCYWWSRADGSHWFYEDDKGDWQQFNAGSRGYYFWHAPTGIWFFTDTGEEERPWHAEEC